MKLDLGLLFILFSFAFFSSLVSSDLILSKVDRRVSLSISLPFWFHYGFLLINKDASLQNWRIIDLGFSYNVIRCRLIISFAHDHFLYVWPYGFLVHVVESCNIKEKVCTLLGSVIINVVGTFSLRIIHLVFLYIVIRWWLIMGFSLWSLFVYVVASCLYQWKCRCFIDDVNSWFSGSFFFLFFSYDFLRFCVYYKRDLWAFSYEVFCLCLGVAYEIKV